MHQFISKTASKIIFLLILLGFNYTFAWIYPEHRDITLLAVEKLDHPYRLSLDKLWFEARMGFENRLTETIIDTLQTIDPEQLDFAAWPAISGDHSCSPDNLLSNVLHTEWILQVANVAAHLKIDLANSENRHEHLNALRDSDIKLQREDPLYATRAGSNNVHFLLALPDANTEVRDYLMACLTSGAELNALGSYTWFHISALQKAAKFFNESLSKQERSALIRSALADEAFALHFLEDSFAAGHTAGTWGDASQRKGTHDYYNERGLAVTTWDGRRLILTGDAFMREQEAEIAAIAVGKSLEQVIDAATGKLIFDYQYNNTIVEAVPDTFNVCKSNIMAERKVDPAIIGPCAEILVTTPVPGLATGLGEYPRFRSELGTFVGAVSALRGNTVSGGFGVNQNDPGGTGGIDVGVRLGVGLEGVMHGGGDGLVFFEFGWRQDASSSMKYGSSEDLEQGGQIAAAIPGREAIYTRYRMPFYLLPLDLLITAPILLLASPNTWASMAVSAGLGGLIPWQAGIETGIGRFQFILGREFGITFYGRGDNIDALLIPVDGNVTALVNYKSTAFDFPIVEYRPFRTFSLDQSSSMVVQFNFGVDIPKDQNAVLPEGTVTPDLRPVWSLGMRIAFDWRYYW
jgi:hypothetical protein